MEFLPSKAEKSKATVLIAICPKRRQISLSSNGKGRKQGLRFAVTGLEFIPNGGTHPTFRTCKTGHVRRGLLPLNNEDGVFLEGGETSPFHSLTRFLSEQTAQARANAVLDSYHSPSLTSLLFLPVGLLSLPYGQWSNRPGRVGCSFGKTSSPQREIIPRDFIGYRASFGQPWEEGHCKAPHCDTM